MEIKKISIAEKMSQFSDYWNPRIVGELNGQHIKLVKAKGEFEWHKHDNEDEMFLVIKGEFNMELRNKRIPITEGEFIIIPKGIEHRPVVKNEVEIMLFEPATTISTGGNEKSELTQKRTEWI
ncbi:cupin domain-containing protein [Zunongwangia sp. F260]|uniref:Cupin domain-containing protein n=1 Tax=Autumnicola lenta TaxID=3075593 RepID=A0ABU3CPA2_9FLAO|nr:cupin domain-containing protein [Zunongwangia sp. F260]MDT0648185.1 cupin domain-containing protein [Zunongwangia sp. F260]